MNTREPELRTGAATWRRPAAASSSSSCAAWRALSCGQTWASTVNTRAWNEPSRSLKFQNHGDGPLLYAFSTRIVKISQMNTDTLLSASCTCWKLAHRCCRWRAWGPGASSCAWWARLSGRTCSRSLSRGTWRASPRCGSSCGPAQGTLS